jgi:hypothetical protein
MSFETVPCAPAGASSWTQRTSLDGTDFVLRFDWSQRTGLWLFTVSDQDGAAIVSGRALTTSSLPLRGVRDARRPRGELVVSDTTGKNNADPGFDDLGGRFELVYVSASELGR